MGLRGWGIAHLLVGIIVIGTGTFAAFSAREMWQDSEARCASVANEMCGAGESLAAAFLFLLGPLGLMIGVLLLLAGAIVLALARRVERALDKGLAALSAALE